MNDRLRQHVDMLFADAPSGKRYDELREELLANLNEKYEDLIAQGMSEEMAISKAIAGIGDIEELFYSIEATSQDAERARNRSGLGIAIAVTLSMVAMVIAFFISYALIRNIVLSLGISIGFAVLAAALYLYFQPATPVQKREGTIVEGLLANKPDAKLREIAKTVHSVLWSLTVVVYFLFSFATRAWHLSWTIFLAAAMLQQILDIAVLYMNPDRSRKRIVGHCTSALWLFIVIFYILFSFGFGAWAYSWIIFIIGAALGQILRLVFKLTE